jgi:hypothetical protein
MWGIPTMRLRRGGFVVAERWVPGEAVPALSG